MSITPTEGVATAPPAGLVPATSTAASDDKQMFLELMVAQLRYQDPLNPMQNSEFLGQLAQFSTVQGIQGLQSTMDGFTSSLATDQMLRGASLVGRSVLVPSAKMSLGAEGKV